MHPDSICTRANPRKTTKTRRTLLASGAGFLTAVFASRSAGEGWAVTALATAAFVAWITVLNLFYLLMQIVIAVDDCSVASAATRVTAFVRRERRQVLSVFLVVLVLVVFATGASWLAMAALGLIAFVPFVGLTVLPLQLVAWVLRGLVFQYIGLASIGAYVKLYRGSAAPIADEPVASDLDLRRADLYRPPGAA